jgi:hypothetical protein
MPETQGQDPFQDVSTFTTARRQRGPESYAQHLMDRALSRYRGRVARQPALSESIRT